MRVKNVLFCYSRIPSFTNAVRDYVESFGRYSRHRIHYFDMDSGPLDIDLQPFDAIVFNYCFWARCLEVDQQLIGSIARFRGLKIAILQDEYDYFLWHRETICTLGIDVLVTCVPPQHWTDLYRGECFDRIKLVHAFTGYVPESFHQAPSPKPFAERKWWVGYRGRPVPYRYGRLTQEKVLIAEGMQRLCRERGVPANIDTSEQGRLYGAAWTEFIRDCRVVLGTESGSNIFDFDGRIAAAIDEYLADHPEADFETVYERFLEEHEGRIRMNQVSPRIFEAIALGTGLVLFEGEYSGVVRPWEHYIPLKKDFSNIDEVLRAIEDPELLKSITHRAYEEVIASGKYDFSTYIGRLDDLIDDCVPTAKGYRAVYGLVAWRRPDGRLASKRAQPLRTSTTEPLRHIDNVPDPVLIFRLDLQAVRRRLMRCYERLLHSPWGKRTQARLQRHALLYATLRWGIRRMTGRH